MCIRRYFPPSYSHGYIHYTVCGVREKGGGHGKINYKKKWEERNTAEYTATKYYLFHTKNICKPAEKTLKGNLKYNYSWKI